MFCILYFGSNGYFSVVEDCKTRWRNLRDYYMRNKSKSTGSQADESSTVPAMLQRLSFLQLSEHHRVTKTNIAPIAAPPTSSTSRDSQACDSAENTPHTQTEGDSTEFNAEYLDINTDFGDDFSADGNTLNDSMDAMSTTSTATTNTAGGKRRRIDKEFEKFMESQNNQLEVLKEAITPLGVKDELSCFFDSMEATTRKLPKHLQLKLKRGISNLVYDAEEEMECSQSQNDINFIVLPADASTTQNMDTL